MYFLNGFTGLVYLHLDCVDGKQARRTKSSSPLGQLFDHGTPLKEESTVHAYSNHMNCLHTWLVQTQDDETDGSRSGHCGEQC